MDRRILDFTEAYKEFFFGDKLDGYTVFQLEGSWRVAVHESLTLDQAVDVMIREYANKETKQ